MSLCYECETYESVLEADRSEPSVRMKTQGNTGFTYAYPLTDTGLCYYCNKKQQKRISGRMSDYGPAYGAKDK